MVVLRGSRVTAELTGRGCTGRSLGLSRASDAKLELGDVTLWPWAGGGGLPHTLPGPSPEAANFSLYFLAARWPGIPLQQRSRWLVSVWPSGAWAAVS